MKKISHQRLLGALLLIFTVTIVGTAAYLEPDPYGTGVGTHTLLGMEECSFLVALGFPCPFCGLTTTFCYVAHLQLVEGFCNQPFGFGLFVVVLLLMVISFMDVIFPKNRLWNLISWIKRNQVVVLSCFVIPLLLGWFYKIVLML